MFAKLADICYNEYMTEPTLRKAKIDEFRPQEQNANRHTQRGMRELEKSIGEDGYVAPMSAAADGELLDGSARLETVANLFDEEVFVVEHDGSVPIVMKRTDIPDAKADIARRISIRANRIAELNLDWDPETLLGSVRGLELSGLFTEKERQLFETNPPSLDGLAGKFGEPGERDFWPVIRVQVSPETEVKFKAAMTTLPGADEAEKFDALVSGYELE